MKRHLSVAVLLGAALLSSCDALKDTGPQDISATDVPSARIKFHNFSPSSVGVDFFAGNTKMSGVLTSACANPATDSLANVCATTGSESTTGTAYGVVASGGRYDAIPPGQYTLTARIAANPDVVSSVSQAIADGKYYSYFMSGLYNTTSKTAEAFVIEDPVPTGAMDFSAAKVRFVNAVSDGTGPFTLYVTNGETKLESPIGGAVAYKSGGAFVSVPQGTYSLSGRYTGSATSTISRTAVSFLAGHLYTITARGITATSSTLGFDYTENQP